MVDSDGKPVGQVGFKVSCQFGRYLQSLCTPEQSPGSLECDFAYGQKKNTD